MMESIPTFFEKRFRNFIKCHEGFQNRLWHLAGFVSFGVGIVYKSLLPIVLGGLLQEFGHYCQYRETKDYKNSILACMKSQPIFALPLFVLAIAYVLLAK